MSTLTWIVGIFVTLAIVLISPVLIFSGPVDVLPNDTVWVNNAVPINHDSGGPGTAFWYVLSACALSVLIMFLWIVFMPIPYNEDLELFDRWDGRC